MSDPKEQIKKAAEFDEIYNNIMQLKANIIDANKMLLEVGRGGGKTEWFGKRLTDVAYDMPQELSFFAHKTYMALFSNIIPNLIAYFNKPRGKDNRPILREGIDYVVGEKDLPSHFTKPRYPLENPKHSIVFCNGHHIRLVSSDQPESVAGANGVHAFIEEMKHNKGERVKTRIIPALRGGSSISRKSHYYQGLTGVSDAARVDLGEDDWFNDYEKLVDDELIKEIVTVSLHINKALYKIEDAKKNLKGEKDATKIKQHQNIIRKNSKVANRWAPIIRQMRKAAIYYLRASAFVNKDFLGINYFKTQLDSLSTDEFLAAIANIRPQRVVDLFFSGFDNNRHTFSDSYKYNSIHDFNLKDTFKLTAEYLKYFDPNKPLILGYDPGHFSSIVASQLFPRQNELRVLKEFFCWIPKEQGDLAKQINEFFGPHLKTNKIILYYDRAANKSRTEQDRITSDARLLEKALKDCGFKVEMKNEKQRTIYHYEHFKLIGIILRESFKKLPVLRICENECPNLVSSINLSPVDRKDGKIQLDKTSERKVALQHQAGLTTQLPSALMYKLFGLFSKYLPKEIANTPDYPDNYIV